MRQDFSGWYSKSPQELDALWSRAIFVPDANILLHCFRHAESVREELLRILEVLSNSLWIPYQIGLEFHRNRLEVEYSALDAYDRVVKEYEATFLSIKEKLRQMRAHPTIKVEDEVRMLDEFLDGFRERMHLAKSQHPNAALATTLIRVTELFQGKVGKKLSDAQVQTIKKEGDERYSKQIPPGYKDKKKDETELGKYGDLIIWKALVEKAKQEQKPIILITDDAKEDWWHIHRGRKIGPRPELIEEFIGLTGEDFHIYELGQFLRIASERYPEITQETVDQIQKSLMEDREARHRIEDVMENSLLEKEIAQFERERDQLISALSGVPQATPIQGLEITDKASMRLRLAELNDIIQDLRIQASSGEQDPTYFS